jgi:indole-3-glycerol phosphate synthase
VLTEPEHFAGDLSHLAAIARAVPVPVMRKDFLVDPYQVLEARAAGAGGVLLIVRLLRDELLHEMLDAAFASGLFVLLECFDAADIERAARESKRVDGAPGRLLLGLNVRDLTTFAIDLGRLEQLVPCFPPGVPRVAESGLAGPADARRAAALGYALALAGTALMQAADPARATAAMIEAGRAVGVPR